MKRLLLTLLIVGIASVAFSQVTKTMKGSQICSMKKSMSATLPALSGKVQSGPIHSFDALKYTLNVDIYDCFSTPYPHSFDATEIIQFRVDSTLNSIVLDANTTSLVINAVSMAGVSFTHAAHQLTIQLDQTYNPGDTVEVGIDYHHNNVDDNAFYAKNGFIFTDCEPEGARKWFPCWDHPSDKAQLDMTAKVPNNVKLGSNGALVDSTMTADTLWYHWVSEHNVPTYIMVLTGKVDYNLDIVYWPKLSNPNDSLPIRFYYNDGEDPSAIEEIILPMADWFSENFCEHPFQKDGFATLNSDFSWGGMENQTLTSLCSNCWSESLTAHEFAHQWYGDMITCATWADIWLNEGFATWSEAFWYESYAGYTAYKNDINGNASSYLGNNPGWAISEPEWAITTPPSNVMFNYAVTYAKGSTILHMLRYVLGDSLFFEAIQTYSNDPELKYYSAVIPDFMQIVNDVTGEDYDWFFNQWIYEPNHPHYQNTYNFKDLGNDQWQVNFYTEQIQPDPEFFRMPMEIKVRFADYSDTIVTVWNDSNYQLFSWEFDKQPVYFQFDPGNNIVIKNQSTILGITDRQRSTSKAKLFQNVPNPTGQSTSISFQIDEPMFIHLALYNSLGKEVLTLVDGNKSTGKHSVTVDCSNLRPGVYLYTLSANGSQFTKKLVVAK